MKARPILFSAPMVRALLEGRKTQTRRIIKGHSFESHPYLADDWHLNCEWLKCPYGKPGDLLWVRETWFEYHHPHRAGYAANQPMGRGGKKRPSIFMPRWASRLTLELNDVRVERLQDISEADAYAEGVAIPSHHAFASSGNPELRNEARCAYQQLWESINGPGSWDANPWVWALTFRVHQQSIDEFIESREAA